MKSRGDQMRRDTLTTPSAPQPLQRLVESQCIGRRRQSAGELLTGKNDLDPAQRCQTLGLLGKVE